MDYKRQEKLVDYLFRTPEIRSFLCNDLYQELLKICKTSDFINSSYISEKNRVNGYKKVSSSIMTFLKQQQIYAKMLLQIYNQEKITVDIIDDLIVGITLYIISTQENYSQMDVFTDKKSICYRRISILDVL